MSALLFIISAALYDIFSWLLMPNELEQYLGITPSQQISPTQSGIAFLFITIGLYLAYGLTIRRADQNHPTRTMSPSLSEITLISTLFFISLPILSKDIYKYAFTARIINHYHADPLAQAPDQFPQDPWLPVIDWETTTSAYGPLWAPLAAFASLPTISSLLATAFSIKLLIASFHGGAVYLIRRLTRDRADSVRLTLLYALNPLILIEILGSGHNEPPMVFFLLLSLYYLRKEKVGHSILFWTISLLIKQATLILTPLYLVRIIWKKPDYQHFLILTLGLLLLPALLSPFRSYHGVPLGIHPWYFVWVFPLVIIRARKDELIATIIGSLLLTLTYIPEIANLHQLTIWSTLFWRLIGLGTIAYMTLSWYRAHRLITNQ